MQTPKIVSDFLEAAVPKGLTESRRKLLTDELESHVYDKAEHYIEIGYSEEESFEKAVAEMGDATPVSESFRELYKESHAVNILIMVLLLGINAVASYYNLGGNMVESVPDAVTDRLSSSTSLLEVCKLKIYSVLLFELQN